LRRETVDGNGNAFRLQRGKNGREARNLFFGRHRPGRGIGRGRADVDAVGAIGHQRLRMRQRRLRREEFPAIGKRIFGDVEDAKDFHG